VQYFFTRVCIVIVSAWKFDDYNDNDYTTITNTSTGTITTPTTTTTTTVPRICEYVPWENAVFRTTLALVALTERLRVCRNDAVLPLLCISSPHFPSPSSPLFLFRSRPHYRQRSLASKARNIITSDGERGEQVSMPAM